MANPTAKYVPPDTPEGLVLAWLRRARESQMAHYEMATLLSRRNYWIGIPIVVIAGVVGTSAFASILAELVPLWAKVSTGVASVSAAVLASLQTFFKFAERAERHKTFAAKFGAVRRELEGMHASGLSPDAESVAKVREKLDRLAEEAPAVPAGAFHRVQKAESDAAR